MRVLGWRAWYTDARYTSADTDAADLPANGMVGVVEYREPPYRRIVDGCDWYVWDGERWSGPSGGDTGRWVARPAGDVVIRSAPSLPDGVWAEVQREMMEAREWPSM